MIPLIQIAQDAMEKERANARMEAQQEAERAEREARRRAKLEQCLAGFDCEISFTREGAADVALRHPGEANRWLTFVVRTFSSEDEPLFPEAAHELRVYAGRIARWGVSLGLTANEYIVKR